MAAEGDGKDLRADEDEHQSARDLRESYTAATSTLRFSRLPSAVTRIDRAHPWRPPRSGRQLPAMIEPITATTSPSGGAAMRSALSHNSCGSPRRAPPAARRGPSPASASQGRNVDDVDRRQHQPRQHGGGKERADRLIHDVGQQDENEAWRDDLAQRARGAVAPQACPCHSRAGAGPAASTGQASPPSLRQCRSSRP